MACGTVQLSASTEPEGCGVEWKVATPAWLSGSGTSVTFHAPNEPWYYDVCVSCTCKNNHDTACQRYYVYGVLGAGVYAGAYPVMWSPDNDSNSWEANYCIKAAPEGTYARVDIYAGCPVQDAGPYPESWLDVSGGEPNGPAGPNFVRRIPVWEPTVESVTGTMGCTWRTATIKVVRVKPPLEITGAVPSPIQPACDDANDPNCDKLYFAAWQDDPNECVTFTTTLEVECSPNEAKWLGDWGGGD